VRVGDGKAVFEAMQKLGVISDVGAAIFCRNGSVISIGTPQRE